MQNVRKMKVYRGEAISPGVAMGQVHVFHDLVNIALPKVTIPAAQAGAEQQRMEKAFEATRQEIAQVVEKVHRDIGFEESTIFQTHLLMLNDRKFSGEMSRLIREEHLSADSAVRLVIEHWENTFSRSSSRELQMKAFDILDIGKRLLIKLSAAGTIAEFSSAGAGSVLATRMLLPSHTAFIDTDKVRGIITELGNRASHSAVIAKALGLPAVFGAENIVKNIQNNDEVIVDGSSGIVYVNPDAAVKKEYESFRRKYDGYRKRLEKLTDLPSCTRDGRAIELYANIGALADAELAVKYRAEGVGLYRTEMPFLIRNEFPDEELQYAIYKKVIGRMKGKPVNIRTLDLGGDKMLSFLSMPKEENPTLGWRAIRVFIDNPRFFKMQLKAILRAGAGADINIILPMISDLTEVHITRKILADAVRDLQKEKKEFNPAPRIGIMIEVPSAVALADILIQEVDFFSIGTNDLIQYTLAVDRNSEKAARYFEPLNPAVIRMLKHLADVTAAAGKDASVCGEVASDPLFIPLLTGLGYRKLSVNPLAINMVKDIVRTITYAESRGLVTAVLRKKTGKDIRSFMQKYLSGLTERGLSIDTDER